MLLVLMAFCYFLGLAFFKRYTKYGFYIAQAVFCLIWIFSTLCGDPNGFISLGHPVWVYASLAALTIRKNEPLFPKEDTAKSTELVELKTKVDSRDDADVNEEDGQEHST